jgi:hypothetical protein
MEISSQVRVTRLQLFAGMGQLDQDWGADQDWR